MTVTFMTRANLEAAGGNAGKAYAAQQAALTAPAWDYLRFEKGSIIYVPGLGCYTREERIKNPSQTGAATSCVDAVKQQAIGSREGRVSAMKIYTGIKQGSPAHLLTYLMQDYIYRRISDDSNRQQNHGNILDREGSAYIPDIQVAVFLLHMFTSRTSAAHVLMQKGYTLREALLFGKTFFETLEYMHGKGIVHRDLKPQNILEDSVVKNGKIVGVMPEKIQLFDFDVSWDRKYVRWSDEKLNPGSIVGTPGYIAPEILSGKSLPTETKMDIYSGTMTLFDLITGKHGWDFKGMNPIDAIRKTAEWYRRGEGLPERFEVFDEIEHNGPIRKLIKEMLTAGFECNPDNRPNAGELAKKCGDILKQVPDVTDYHSHDLETDDGTVVDVNALQGELYKKDLFGTVCMDEDVSKTVLAA